MSGPRGHEVPLSKESSGRQKGNTESREGRQAHPRPGSSAASSEGTPEVARNRCMDIRTTTNRERFKWMVWGERYEGKYSFVNVDQADEEIAFLTERVEQLEKGIEGFCRDLEGIYSKYRNARQEGKRISEDIGRLQEDLKVQNQIMETAQEEGTKLEEKIDAYKESKGKFEVQVKYAQEARQKLMSGRPCKIPHGEGSPDVPRKQGDNVVQLDAPAGLQAKWTTRWCRR